MYTRKVKSFRLEYIALLVLICDQLTKWLMVTQLPHKIALIPQVNLALTYNHGAAFGMLSEAGGWQRWFFVLIAIVITTFGIVWMRRLKPHEDLTAMGIALLLGGAIGNVIDRVRLGYVVDFIDFYIGGWHWYTFNVADIAICVGAFIIVIAGFRS